MLDFKSTIFYKDISQLNHAVNQCELTNLSFRTHHQYKGLEHDIFFLFSFLLTVRVVYNACFNEGCPDSKMVIVICLISYAK